MNRGRAALLLLVWCATAAFTVRLRDAEVGGARVTLGEIARIEGAASEALAERLGAIEIARGLPAGARRGVSADGVHMRLLAEGFPRGGFFLTGPAEIAVVRRGQTVEAEAIKAAVEAALAERTEPGDLVEIGRLPSRLPTFPEGDLVLEATVRGANVLVEIRSGEIRHRLAVPFSIRRFRPVAIAARRIERREVASEADFRWEMREIGRLAAPVLSFEEIRGLAARQPILEGIAVARTFFEEPLLVRSGQSVAIVARAGGVFVTMPGRAGQDGRLGDTVRATSDGGGRAITGRVTARGEVTVLE